MALIEMQPDNSSHPVDMIEHLATANDWTFDRSNQDEITISVAGSHCDYHVSITWMDELEALHIACAFDMKVPEARRGEVLRLLHAINEGMWVGHFDLWSDEGLVMYRYALLIAGSDVTDRQC